MTMRLRAAALLALMGTMPTFGQVAVPPPQAGRDTQTQAQAPATALIVGTVVTGSGGQPADGVRLTLSGAELRGTRSSLSDDNGKFAFLSLPPGTYTLRAVKTGYVSATFGQKSPGRPGTPIVLAVGQQLKDISLEVPKALAAREVQMQMDMQMSGGGPRLWALAEVTVDGGYSPSVALSLQEGMTVSGSVSFDGTAPLPPRLNQVRLTLSPHGLAMQSSGVSTLNVSADANGRFTLAGVVPGQYRIRASSVAGWSLKSVMVDGRDSLDFWVDVKPGENVSGVVATFGDKSTDLKGMLQSQTGQPTADYTVIIFPADNRYWVPLSRRVRSARPSTDGKFGFLGLPAGEYRLAAVTDVESGAWYDPVLLQQLMQASVSVRLIDGQPVIQNLRVSGS